MAIVHLKFIHKGNLNDERSVQVEGRRLRSIIAIAIVSFFLVGDTLDSILNPRLKRR